MATAKPRTPPLSKNGTNGHKPVPTKQPQASTITQSEKELAALEEVALRDITPEHEGENQRLKNLLQVIEAVHDTRNIRVKTILNTQQIRAVSKGYIYADRFNSQVMRDFIQYILELKVSGSRREDGSGRNDMVEALRATIVTSEVEEHKSRGLAQRLLGLGGR